VNNSNQEAAYKSMLASFNLYSPCCMQDLISYFASLPQNSQYLHFQSYCSEDLSPDFYTKVQDYDRNMPLSPACLVAYKHERKTKQTE
jgi:hypothetical protein